MTKTQTVRPVGFKTQHVYNGFEYLIEKKEERCWIATPLLDQHSDAWKIRHRSSAVMDYLEQHRES